MPRDNYSRRIIDRESELSSLNSIIIIGLVDLWNRSNRKSCVLLETYNCCYVPIPKIPTSERIEAQLQRFYRHQGPKKESSNT